MSLGTPRPLPYPPNIDSYISPANHQPLILHLSVATLSATLKVTQSSLKQDVKYRARRVLRRYYYSYVHAHSEGKRNNTKAAHY
jgi:hypothetical protein